MKSIDKDKTVFLLIDDEKGYLEMLALNLSTFGGFQEKNILKANSIEDAILIIKNNIDTNGELHCIISDYVFPSKTGIDMFSEINTMKPEFFNKIKKILITGLTSEYQHDFINQECQKMDIDILFKPFSTNSLFELLEK